MNKFLKIVLCIFSFPKRKTNKYLNFFFNFILPNVWFLILKSMFYSNKPTCNQKTFLTGLGIIYIGKNCTFGYKQGGFYRGGTIEFQVRFKDAIIKIGDNVTTNNNIFLCAASYIEIGDNTLIGQNVTIMDFEAHSIDPKERRNIGQIGKVYIGKNVWIGNNVTILKNTSIGFNSIVAAGAVVSGDFPANVIIGGVPAKIIREL